MFSLSPFVQDTERDICLTPDSEHRLFASTSLNWLVIRGKVQLAGPSSSTHKEHRNSEVVHQSTPLHISSAFRGRVPGTRRKYDELPKQ